MKTTRMLAFAAISSAALCLFSCSHKEAAPIPRAEAWPRTAVYDSVFAPVDSLPVRILANSGASSRIDRHGENVWLTTAYPRFDASILYTVAPTSPATLPAQMKEAMRRMSTSVANASFDISEKHNPAGWKLSVCRTMQPSPTPVWFFASDKNHLISGAIYLERLPADAPSDSIAPIVETLRRDLFVALDSLR